jgi:hypothetical protein
VTPATRSTISFGKIKNFIPNGIGFLSLAPHLLRGGAGPRRGRTSHDQGHPALTGDRGATFNWTEKTSKGVADPMIEVTAAALAAQPFLRGMPPSQLGRLAEAASDVKFPEGHRIFDDGGHAAAFWLIQCGHVSLDMQVPGEGTVIIDTIGIGELLGLSWLFPPYRWSFGAVCVSPVEAFEFDAAAVRGYCATDPVFGYEFSRRLIPVLATRLQSTRAKLIARSRGAASTW